MSKRKIPKKEFDKATIRVVKSNLYQGFTVDLAKKIGLEKACIIENINDAKDKSFSGLNQHFPYIHPETLKKLIVELIASGDLFVEENNG